MKNQINRENYEAFYLDYLEGNLDEDATLSLFAFLADNPELQVDDMGPELVNSSFVLDADFKNNLKQDLNSQKISPANIEYFLTAEKEKQLSSAKLTELNAFVLANPSFSLDRRIYELTTLAADVTQVFAEKKSLKRRETIVLWPYLSALAAACAVLVLWLLPNPNFNGEIRSAAGVPSVLIKGKKSNSSDKGANELQNIVNHSDYSIPVLAQNTKLPRSIDNRNSIVKKSVQGNLSFRKVEILRTYNLENVDFTSNLKETQPTAIGYQQTEVLETPITTLAMTNPVKPLTNKLSDIIKTQVDYKTGENTDSQRKGFYLKIGQFEISQNKKVKN